MAQRGMIAMAALCLPKIIIADEPTSSLDLITQQSIIELLKSMSCEFDISVIFITHDLQLAGKLSDRVIVLSRGRVVEQGKSVEVLNNPKSEAGASLTAAAIRNVCEVGNKRKLDDKDILLRVTDLCKSFNKHDGSILQDISISLHKGEMLGLAGESGCGKSTLARLIARIIKPSSGGIFFKGTDIYKNSSYPQFVQMVFQNPFLSLDPQMKVRDIIMEGARRKKHFGKREIDDMVGFYLEMVGLDAGIGSRYPWQLSGGQCQRVSIARSLIMKPELVVCDEPTSSLDTVSQAQILELFGSLKNEKDIGYLFISHDIRILGSICDRIAVMHKGRIVETGNCEDILTNPVHPYTRTLVKAAYEAL
ncbi:MAG: Glutathione import ATP-binding protein GsiA [Firmicutes bacterium ADurb.Bin419]|nr:MAG: Glutathione import ATP-binding protein GsiA [Firmicutes bacterium ADurb.Bin419]